MIKFEEDIILKNQQADQLVHDIKKYVNKHSLASIHGGRFVIQNTSNTFRELLNKSDVWRKFYSFFSSEEFLNTCLEKLEMTEIDVRLNHYFSKSKYLKWYDR